MNNKQGFTLTDWVKTKSVDFDLTDEYMKEIDPIVQQLKSKCEALGIPFCFTAAHADNAQKTAMTQAVHFPDVTQAPLQVLLARLCIHADDDEPFKAYFIAHAMKQLEISPPADTPARFDA